MQMLREFVCSCVCGQMVGFLLSISSLSPDILKLLCVYITEFYPEANVYFIIFCFSSSFSNFISVVYLYTFKYQLYNCIKSALNFN